MVAKFEEYVECSLKNWKWLEQARFNNGSTHWPKRLKTLTDWPNHIRMNREKVQGGFPEGIRKLCDILVQWVGRSLPGDLQWASWPLRPLGRKVNFQPQRLLIARQDPGICITCGEVWCKQDHQDHPSTAHWEIDRQAGGENLRSKPILLNFWDREILPDFSIKK